MLKLAALGGLATTGLGAAGIGPMASLFGAGGPMAGLFGAGEAAAGAGLTGGMAGEAIGGMSVDPAATGILGNMFGSDAALNIGLSNTVPQFATGADALNLGHLMSQGGMSMVPEVSMWDKLFSKEGMQALQGMQGFMNKKQGDQTTVNNNMPIPPAAMPRGVDGAPPSFAQFAPRPNMMGLPKSTKDKFKQAGPLFYGA